MHDLANEKLTLIQDIQSLDGSIRMHEHLPEMNERNLTDAVIHISETFEMCQSQNIINGKALKLAQMSINRLQHAMIDAQGKENLTYNIKGAPQIKKTLGAQVRV